MTSTQFPADEMVARALAGFTHTGSDWVYVGREDALQCLEAAPPPLELGTYDEAAFACNMEAPACDIAEEVLADRRFAAYQRRMQRCGR